MQKIKNLSLIYTFFVFCLVLIFAFQPLIFNTDATENYSNVLDDLKRDPDFIESVWIENKNDYSLNVIQVAESKKNELFVYVYQPSADTKYLKASTINISTAINDNLSYKNYKLQLLNNSGVFYKYIVEDFKVKNDALRYYDISSIFRFWNKQTDPLPEDGNTVTEVAYNVEKLFTASTVNEEVTYTCLDTETLVITDKYVGFVRYKNGFTLYLKSCDSHFIAFSTNKPIEKLIDADVYFKSKEFSTTNSILGENTTYRDPKDEYVKLTYTDKIEKPSEGMFGHQYSWNRIESVADFVRKEDLTDSANNSLKGKQWVLRFKETDYNYTRGTAGNSFANGRVVEEVSILRLKFETQGAIYNLGVIDNKQTGDFIPDNKQNIFINVLLTIGFFILIVIFVLAFFPKILWAVVKAIGRGIIWLSKGLWWLITSPFMVFEE